MLVLDIFTTILVLVVIHLFASLLELCDISDEKVRKNKGLYLKYLFFKPFNIISNKKLKRRFENELYKDFYS